MNDSGYGLWGLVILDTVIFSLFAVSFFHPANRREWRAMGAFWAFLAALFAEMYGFPLTVYLLSAWLGSRIPALNDTHAGGHLWNDLVNWPWDPHLSPFHLASYVFIGGGFWLIYAGWRILWQAARDDRLATTGPYEWVRHPQYAGFLSIMVGFLLQWPTLPTLVMFPVLVIVYRRLALTEEREVASHCAGAWDAYASITPRFVPHLHHQRRPAARVG